MQVVPDYLFLMSVSRATAIWFVAALAAAAAAAAA
eukprot:CAMPEP_0172885640 /NCGR_PEP_ID=MMETSP1075-20121228/128727_1 /TAXON_ID=2916 /ORGANISM="Ceratium fusus, Strain PA161109" /LENGTH=34 /DNA_ID= /DNA_START= /DNA_END= /DNA_ORIENTATION=